MASCLIAIDRANKANGCLQVIKGSQKLGRVEHGQTGDQTGADQARVDAALERMELVYCELEPGDAIFFHGNLLHRSDQNTSEHPRWSLICCYNTRRNDVLDAIERNLAPMETFYDGYVVNAIMDAAYASMESKKWEPIDLPIWRGEENVPKISALHEFDDEHLLVKREQMPDGRIKLILKNKSTGKITQQFQEN